MTKRRLLALCGIGCALLLFGLSVIAQEKNPVSAESITLEQIPDALRAADESVFIKTSELLAVVESGMSAKRISEQAGQRLRSALCLIKPPIEIDVSSLLKRTELPGGDGALVKAVKDLEDAWEICKIQRVALVQQAVSQIPKRASDLARTAKSPSDIDPLLATIIRIKTAASRRGRFDFRQLSSSADFLRILQETLEPRSMDDLQKENSLLGNLRATGGGDSDKRIADILEPF
jgi:hypothetical protein